METADDSLAVAAQRVLLVTGVLGDVDMEAGPVPLSARSGGGEDLVVDREGGVKPQQALSRGKVGLGLRQALAPASLSIAHGELVAEKVRKADLLQSLGDDMQTAGHGIGRGVVVDDEGRAAARGLHAAGQGRGADHGEVELLVQVPPHELEQLGKIPGRLARSRHAAGERGVDVVVADHEGLGDDAAAAIEDLSPLRDRRGEAQPPRGGETSMCVRRTFKVRSMKSAS